MTPSIGGAGSAQTVLTADEGRRKRRGMADAPILTNIGGSLAIGGGGGGTPGKTVQR